MKENGFYVMLVIVSVIGILVLGLLIYKASQLPNYHPVQESVSTSSNLPQASPTPVPTNR